MKIDLEKVIKDFEGNDIYVDLDSNTAEYVSKAFVERYEELYGKGSANKLLTGVLKLKNKKLTIGRLCRIALARGLEDSTADQKWQYYNIGLRCEGKTVDLDDSEREKIKKLVNELKYSPIVYGRLCQEFESAVEEKKK